MGWVKVLSAPVKSWLDLWTQGAHPGSDCFESERGEALVAGSSWMPEAGAIPEKEKMRAAWGL